MKARCYGIGFVMLCLAALYLLLDLGRPELAFLLTRPTLSIRRSARSRCWPASWSAGFAITNRNHAVRPCRGAQGGKRRAWRCRWHDGTPACTYEVIRRLRCGTTARLHVRVVVVVGGRLGCS
ncbi:MAG: hypothetical protein ACLT98_15930 [Eggerthellaceae bacterium]